MIGGGLTNLLLNVSGMTMEEARYWQSHWVDMRTQYHGKKAEEHRQKEENILLYKYSKTHPDGDKLHLDHVDHKS